MRSIRSRNPIPVMKPTAAGMTAHLPMFSHIFMLGISNDHTEAAIMTPEAKPNSAFCTRGAMSFFIKKTKAEPKTVPNKGMRSPINIIFNQN